MKVKISVAIGILCVAVYMTGCGNPTRQYAPQHKMELQEQVAAPSPMMQVAPMEEPRPAENAFNTEEYDRIQENAFQNVRQHPLSTFSIDVDTAAYSNMRRFLQDQTLPPEDAIRIEELINYFDYHYPEPEGDHPLSLITELSSCPWNPEHQLIHIGLQGKRLDYDQLDPCNLVFLVDSSGSMAADNKLPLMKKALGLLLDQLGPKDRVSIVAYAGSAGLVLPSTQATRKDVILDALARLDAGGSTAGGEGVDLAYRIAQEHFIEGGNNRVILATDGDFNVGVSSTAALVRMVEAKRKQGIYLTIIGLGMGNFKDGRMEQISNAGNGNYFYVDQIREAKKVFVEEMRATLFTIAKDVKIQVEFNPAKVKAYRLIGYENRIMAAEDFNDDLKDAGELGAGHTVTALYELIPAGSEEITPTADELKYQDTQINEEAQASDEILNLKLRYKPIGQDTSLLITQPVLDETLPPDNTSQAFRFSAAVAEFGMLLRKSEYKGQATFENVLTLAKGSLGTDDTGYRHEFIQLVETAALLANTEP